MRTLGYLMLTVGVFLLVVPVALLFWAFQMYTVGFSVNATSLIIWTVATLSGIGGGLYLLRRSRSRNPSPDGRGRGPRA